MSRFEQRGEEALCGLIEAEVGWPLVGAEGEVDALEGKIEWRRAKIEAGRLRELCLDV